MPSLVEGRLSVSIIDVSEEQEEAFLAIAREFAVIMAKKNADGTFSASSALLTPKSP